VPMGITVSKSVATAIASSFTLVERPAKAVKGKGLLTSYFIAYRDHAPKAVDGSEVTERYDKALAQFEAGNADFCARLPELFDFTTVEPEAASALLSLAARAALVMGDQSLADEYARRAGHFAL